ncbi:MAG: hypothetical protein U0975_01795 [Erythrobacter sp.]|nr:hypothetical protein [Erythrobacter sp.]MDZ4271383.1 hypothetical protein [Erythrobacter sp.]
MRQNMIWVAARTSGLVFVGMAFITADASSASAPHRPAMDSQATPQLVERLFDCREVVDPNARLACYDREVANVEQATQSDDLVITDREQLREARKGLFGLTLPKLQLFDRGSEEDRALNQIEGVIASARMSSGGKLIVTLEDGVQWIQTDETPIPGSVRPGSVITIKKAAMGSFLAKIGTKRAFRIQRLN